MACKSITDLQDDVRIVKCWEAAETHKQADRIYFYCSIKLSPMWLKVSWLTSSLVESGHLSTSLPKLPLILLTLWLPTSVIRASYRQLDSEDLTWPYVGIKQTEFSRCVRFPTRVLSSKCWLPLDIVILYQKQDNSVIFFGGDKKIHHHLKSCLT